MHLQIKLLGNFQITAGGESLPEFESLPVRSLLAYLLLHRGQAVERSRIAFLFWPDSSETQARTNLRKCLHALRKGLSTCEDHLTVSQKTLTWNRSKPIDYDVDIFEKSLTEAENAAQIGDVEKSMKEWQSAIECYEGELLPDVYEEWIESERERLSRAYASALESITRLLEDRRCYKDALDYAHRLRHHEPTREPTYVTLIRLALLTGNRSGALEIYEECAEVLKRELGVEPGTTLRSIRERLVAGEELSPAEETARSRELSLEGRHTEWAQLKELWTHVKIGDSRLVVLTGEPGIGKTRLAEELVMWVESQGVRVARARSYAAEGRLAFAPAADWLRTKSLRSAAKKLEPAWQAELARLIPDFGITEETINSAGDSLQRHKLFEALSRGVLAGGGATLLLADDMQWMDRETLEWLRYLLRFAPKAPLLVLGTIRSGEITSNSPIERLLLDLRRDEKIDELRLEPMSRQESGRVASQILDRDLSKKELDKLYHETDGNPLFIVESARADSHEDRASEESSSVPSRVHAVIQQRLESISPAARDLATVAAVIGRDFDLDLLASASEIDVNALTKPLEELWERRIIKNSRIPGRYDYSHDRLREVAYALVSPVRKPILHRRIADILERFHAEDLDRVSGQLAFHYEASGKIEEAIHACRRSAEAARKVFAYEEAMRLIRKAIGLLEQLESMSAKVKAECELELQSALGACLVSTHGYSAPGVVSIYERAIALNAKTAQRKDGRLLRALAVANLQSGNIDAARALGEELLELHASDKSKPLIFVEGNYVLGASNFWLGEFEHSRTHFQAVLDSFRPEEREAHLVNYVQDPFAIALSRLSLTQVYLDLPEEALQTVARTVAYLEKFDHPYSEAYARYFCAHTCADLCEWEQAKRYLTDLEKLLELHPQTYWHHHGLVLKGWLKLQQGEPEAALSLMEQGIAMYEDLQDTLFGSQCSVWFATTCLACGQLERAKVSVAKGFAYIERSGERFCESELHRISGEIALEESDLFGAERCFNTAIKVAEERGASFLLTRAIEGFERISATR